MKSSDYQYPMLKRPAKLKINENLVEGEFFINNSYGTRNYRDQDKKYAWVFTYGMNRLGTLRFFDSALQAEQDAKKMEFCFE